MKNAGGAHRDDHDDEPTPQTRQRQRGGSPAAIAGALHRTPHPGPQHWGGPRPRKADPDPFFSSKLTPPPGERLRRR
ncbi:calcium-binding protein [Nocardiopsis dassonvillei]|uniref:calcium-binding protein n=1 Tax=Nocardiopsis dassonvillei TaxID=2014 RepID=UPI003F57AE4E